MSKSKWHRIKSEEAVKESEAEKELKNQTDAVDNPFELRELQTTRGAVDLPEEKDAQKNNLGSKDTPLEIEEHELDTPKLS